MEWLTKEMGPMARAMCGPEEPFIVHITVHMGEGRVLWTEEEIRDQQEESSMPFQGPYTSCRQWSPTKVFKKRIT